MRTIDIELIELSLVSVAPITVTFGAEPPDFYDLFITEDGLQAQGQLQMNALQIVPAPQGTMALQGLPVQFQIQFVQVAGPGNFGIGGSTNFQSTLGNYQALINVPALRGWGSWLMVAALLLAVSAFFVRRQLATRAQSSG